MNRTAERGESPLGKYAFVMVVFAAYIGACLSPLWCGGVGSSSLAVRSGILLTLLFIGFWRYLKPFKQYAAADITFVVTLILAVNLFSNLFTDLYGSGRGAIILQFVYFLIVVSCTLFYSTLFNLATAGLIFVIESANLLFSGGAEDGLAIIGIVVFGLCMVVGVFAFDQLLKSDHQKRDQALQAIKHLNEGAANIDLEQDGDARTLSQDVRNSELVDGAKELDKILLELLKAVRSSIKCDNALLFMKDSSGDNLYIRLREGDERLDIDDLSLPFGKGLVGWVAKEKSPLLVKENARGLGYGIDDGSVQSFIAAPVMNANFLEGVIAVDSTMSDVFTETDRDALVHFAGVLTHLLRRARAYQQADLSAKNFAALHSISKELSASLDLKTILEKLSSLTRNIIKYDQMTLSFNEKNGMAGFKVLIGFDIEQPPKEAEPYAGSLLGWIVDNRQTLNFSDLDRRNEKLPLFPCSVLDSDCRSFIGIPLMSQDKVFGVLTYGIKAPNAITAYQQHMLSVIANQVAVNIANAKLHNVMRQMATVDGLTGLVNHRHFQDKLDEEFVRAERYPEQISLMLIDIDFFKKVNDTYGHPAGDFVLKKMAAVIRETVRTVDLPARYGGEEFVVMMPNTDFKSARDIAERLRISTEKCKFVAEGKTIPITISVGFSIYPEDAANKKELISRADQALYWAKHHGRNRVCAWKEVSAEEPVGSGRNK